MLPLRVRVDQGAIAIKGYSAFPQISSFTGASPSDCLGLYLGHLFGEFYSPAEKQSVYFTTPADWAMEREREFERGGEERERRTEKFIYEGEKRSRRKCGDKRKKKRQAEREREREREKEKEREKQR